MLLRTPEATIMSAIPDLSRTLARAREGDATAAIHLVELLYEELRALARARMARLQPGQTIQATELVHEAYVRVSERQSRGWDGRAHFFFAAARAMRDILVERSRRKGAVKHGGELIRIELDGDLAVEFPSQDLGSLDPALDRLEQRFPDHHQVVMLRYFAGLSGEETAAVLGVSRRTQTRRWEFARAWLHRELTGPGETA